MEGSECVQLVWEVCACIRKGETNIERKGGGEGGGGGSGCGCG